MAGTCSRFQALFVCEVGKKPTPKLVEDRQFFDCAGYGFYVAKLCSSKTLPFSKRILLLPQSQILGIMLVLIAHIALSQSRFTACGS